MCKNKIIKLNKLLIIIMLSSLLCRLRKRLNLQANNKLIDLIALRLNKNCSIIQVIQARQNTMAPLSYPQCIISIVISTIALFNPKI